MAVQGSLVVLVLVAVKVSLVGTGFSDGRGLIGWYWFQWRYRVHWFVLVSVAIKVSFVGTGLSGGNIFVKQNTTFVTKRPQNFGSESYSQ